MSKPDTDRTALLAELLRRKRAQTSLHTYALSIDIPTAPMPALQPDETLTGPACDLMATHHAAILSNLERTVNRPFGRSLIMAPPGSAKSSYASVVLPTFEMGRKPGSRIILTSYATPLAERLSRRAQQIARSQLYKELWPEGATLEREAAGDWSLTNHSEMLAAGLTAGITGNRASGWIVDDPVKGREEADSTVERQNTLDAYQDDLLSRVLPGAWGVIIMTRWNELDLAGSILPDDYDGHSGMIKCKDGLMWDVLNIQAKCERADDPLGRKLGEYMWPEWFPPQHWQMVENAASKEAQRSWSSLYQQRPSPQGSGAFDRAWFKWDEPAEYPTVLRLAGASDFAVTEGGGDWTEHSVWGMDSNGELWLIAGWTGQVSSDKSIDTMLSLAHSTGTRLWFDESGVIHKAIGPALNRRMRERKVYLDLRSLPSTADKIARLQSFQARAASGAVHLPKSGPHFKWAVSMVEQLVALPAGRYDDKADCAGLIGRAVDQIANARLPNPERERGIRPFTAQWLEYTEKTTPRVRYR